MANYWKLYKRAKTFYFSIEKVKCPALNGEEIIFDWRGFRHFLHKGRGKRSIPDQIRRFKLLFEIGNLIKNSELSNDQYTETPFLPLFCKDKNEIIKIVTMRDNSGKRFFISIMNYP